MTGAFPAAIVERLASRPVLVRSATMAAYTCLVAEPGYERNIHSDAEVARRAGLDEPIAEGRMWTTLLSAVLGTTLGPAGLSTGAFAVSFTRMVKAGDRITAHAVVTASDAEPEGRRVHFEVWCENQRGDRVVTASASCLAPDQPGLHT